MKAIGQGMSAIGANPTPASAAVTMPALDLLFAERCADDAANVVRTTGQDVTIGFTATALRALTVRGVACYFKPNGGVVAVRLSCWSGAGARLAFVDVNTTTADGIITGTFSSPVSLARGAAFAISAYDKSGNSWIKWAFTKALSSTAAPSPITQGILCGPGVKIDKVGCFAAGDAIPATLSDGYGATCHPVLDGIAL